MTNLIATINNPDKVSAILSNAQQQDHRVLSLEQMYKASPSVFASKPWHKKSDKYRFIPTINVVERMIEEGFVPVRASQSRTRIEGKENFTKHMVRFRSLSHIGNNLTVGDSIPELVLINSHDGASSYQLMAGIFRVVCSNGLIVCSSSFGDIRTRHSGQKDLAEEVIDASYEVIEHMPEVAGQIEKFNAIELQKGEQIAFAKACSIVHNTAIDYSPEQLLVNRRAEDAADGKGNRSLWKTYNVIQENILRGGISGLARNGRQRETRTIKSVHEDIRTNKALWTLTEEMSQLVA